MYSEKVNALVSKLDDEIKNHPAIGAELFKELTAAQHELGILHDTRPICPFLRPHFLSRKQYQTIKQAAEVLASAFERLTEAALEDDKLIVRFDLTEKEERMARINPGYKSLCVTSRLDSFLSDDGFKFLEYNAETPAGVGDQIQFQKIFMRVPPVREFIEKNKTWIPSPHHALLENLLTVYRECGGKEEHPQIAIVDWKGVSTESEFRILQDYFQSRGFKTIIADPHELDFDGEHLYANGFRIDIFYKRVIIHEFLEEFDDTHPLIRAYKAQKVCMANSFRPKIVHKKSSFAVLSDPQNAHLFTDEQQEVIRRHIPWTRRLQESRTTFENKEFDLLELLRKHREKFLLKPNDDYGGKGIIIGWETNQSEWEHALNEALTHSYIAQERAPVKKIKIPMFNDKVEFTEMHIDFNPYLFPSGVEGALVRLSPSSLVNVTQGGGETGLVILEGVD